MKSIDLVFISLVKFGQCLPRLRHFSSTFAWTPRLNDRNYLPHLPHILELFLCFPSNKFPIQMPSIIEQPIRWKTAKLYSIKNKLLFCFEGNLRTNRINPGLFFDIEHIFDMTTTKKMISYTAIVIRNVGINSTEMVKIDYSLPNETIQQSITLWNPIEFEVNKHRQSDK